MGLDSLLFQSRDGTPLTTANVRRQLRQVLEGTGINGVTPHMFRRLEANLWPERRSFPHRQFAMDANSSRCRRGGGTVSSGRLPLRSESSLRAAAVISRRWQGMIADHGGAAAAAPSHLEFYRKPENQVRRCNVQPRSEFRPFCAED
ncbi:hypothetical protein [Cryobacterium sp. TMT2-15-1]|uniref:hypothetical protein n=1 Tax=Cryobacterium sp. TMT2-15-1 TaxID=1259246 RepID=UPI001F542CB6|nr:hypothetical protein [Cryobacterium sp. TMT2-15-1]